MKVTLNEQLTRMRSIMGLNESKRTELEGLNILTKGGISNAEEVLNKFKEGDKSQDQKNIGFMAFAYVKWKAPNPESIISIFNEYNDLVKRNKIGPINQQGDALVIGGERFTSFLSFSEKIHGLRDVDAVSKKYSVDKTLISNKKPIFSNEKFDIFEGNSVEKCITYTRGGLTGRGYSFCIGNPSFSSNYWQSYRDTKASTFYFIIDKERIKTNPDGSVNLDDPLHIVVYDVTKYGIELTDETNRTGTIAEFDKDVEAYQDYLRKNGVPVDKLLVNIPLTAEEEKEAELLGKQNTDLEWFKNLSFDYKSKYIGRGHLLSDEQFDYLLSGLDKEDFDSED